MQQTSFRMWSPQYCAQYIDAFFYVTMPALMNQCKGNVTVLVTPTIDSCVFLDIDISAVLRLAAMSPAVRIKFEHDEAAEHHSAVNDLIDCIQDESDPKWRGPVTSSLVG
jgi:hypothetical protein